MMRKMNMKSIVVAIGAICVFGLGSTQAAELKIGYIDINSALESTAAHKQGMKRLQAFNDKKMKEITALNEKISQEKKALLEQSLAMAPEKMAEKQRELQKKVTAFKRLMADAQGDFATEKNRIDIASMATLNKVMTAYAKQHHYDFLTPKRLFIYADPKHDVTGDIIKLLDKK